LAAFTIWSLPLCLLVGGFALQPRFSRRAAIVRALLSGLAGFGLGFALTLFGGLVLGGWMLAWDFPVFYCWTVAATAGTLAAAALHRQITWRQTLVGSAPVAVLLSALAWYASRPDPAVLIDYRVDPTRDAAQFVFDSVLSRPHPSGNGRGLRWGYHSYSRWAESDSGTRVLIVLERAANRDSVRRALAGHPLVRGVKDTLIDR
jgi:hypothetical protein